MLLIFTFQLPFTLFDIQIIVTFIEFKQMQCLPITMPISVFIIQLQVIANELRAAIESVIVIATSRLLELLLPQLLLNVSLPIL